MAKAKKYKSGLKHVGFSGRPQILARTVYEGDEHIMLSTKGNGYSLKDDKIKFPSIFANVFDVQLTFEKDGVEYTRSLTVQEQLPLNNDVRFRWNNADIFGLLKFFCSPDDRRIILASGIHDFLLEFRADNYKAFEDVLTVKEFIRMTSDAFIFLCIQGGFGKAKATTMGNLVDLFQLRFQRRKWRF